MGLDAVELIMACEKGFGVELRDRDVQRAQTVGALFDLIVGELRSNTSESGDHLDCVRCGYSLRKLTSGRCPECGLAVPVLGENEAGFEGRCWEVLVYLVSEQAGVVVDQVRRETHFVRDLGF